MRARRAVVCGSGIFGAVRSMSAESPMGYSRTSGRAVDLLTRLDRGLGIVLLLVVLIIMVVLLGGVFG